MILQMKQETKLSDAEVILNFLNEKTGKNFKAVKVNLDFIKARLRDGATMQEVKSVIAMKNREWKDDEVMRKFLRPATLFNATKFWQYHGELEVE